MKELQACTHKSAKTRARETQRPASSGCGDVTEGKPGVTSITCVVRHYSKENPARLTYTSAAILRPV